jgi:hypothetical protein
MHQGARLWAAAAALATASGVMAAPVTLSYGAPGTYTFTVPSGVTSIALEAEGGAGGGGSGGSATSSQFTLGGVTTRTTATGAAGGDGALGEQVSQTLTVVPGEVITIVVGAGGVGGEAADSWYPVETADGGAGGSGSPAGAAGGNATGGYNNYGWLSGAGGGGGGGTLVTYSGGPVAAQGGAGGGGGGAAFGLDTTAANLTLVGVAGQAASAGGAGGNCAGWVNPLSVFAVNNAAVLNQACQPYSGTSLFNTTINEHGGAGAAGYTGRGDVAGTGGTGGATVTGGAANVVSGITFYYHTSDGAAGVAGLPGRVQLTYTLPAPVPAAGWPALLLGLLAVGWLGARRVSR